MPENDILSKVEYLFPGIQVKFVENPDAQVEIRQRFSDISTVEFKPLQREKEIEPSPLQIAVTSGKSHELTVLPFEVIGLSNTVTKEDPEMTGGILILINGEPQIVITAWDVPTFPQDGDARRVETAYYALNINQDNIISTRDSHQRQSKHSNVEAELLDNNANQGRGLWLLKNQLWIDCQDGQITVDQSLPQLEKAELSGETVPDLYPAQLEIINEKTLRAEDVREWDPQKALEILKQREGQRVIAVDIGGDEMKWQTLEVRDGRLIAGIDELLTIKKEGDGANYFTGLEEVVKLARELNIPVGISIAGKVSGTKVLENPNIKGFINALKNKYHGDLAEMFAGVQFGVVNDAVAGLMSATVEVYRRSPEIKHVEYVIIGSGIGLAVYTKGRIIASEAGHVIPVIPELNPHRQTKPCGFLGESQVCLERVGGGGIGIEEIWLQLTRRKLTGRQIAQEFLQGNLVAWALYATSAQIVAHIVEGMRKSFNLSQDTAVVLHGGVTHVPMYADMVERIVGKARGGVQPKFIKTIDYTTNACLEGAGYAWLVFP